MSDPYEDEYAQYDEDDDAVKCATCQGTGIVNPLTAPPGTFCAGTMDCPHCDGTGEVL